MRYDPKTVARGLAKFLAVAVGAGLCGAVIGVALAALTGDDSPSEITAKTFTTTTNTASGTTTTNTASGTTTTDTASGTTSTTQTAAKSGQPPRVAILIAQLGRTSAETGRARVIVRTRVTNRRDDTLTLKSPVLVSGDDEVPLDDDAKDGAGPLLGELSAGADAIGVLKFTLPAAVTKRIAADPRARLRIAGRSITLKLRLPKSNAG